MDKLTPAACRGAQRLRGAIVGQGHQGRNGLAETLGVWHDESTSFARLGRHCPPGAGERFSLLREAPRPGWGLRVVSHLVVQQFFRVLAEPLYLSEPVRCSKNHLEAGHRGVPVRFRRVGPSLIPVGQPQPLRS